MMGEKSHESKKRTNESAFIFFKLKWTFEAMMRQYLSEKKPL